MANRYVDKMPRVLISLPQDYMDDLETITKRDGTPRNTLIRRAVGDMLARDQKRHRKSDEEAQS